MKRFKILFLIVFTLVLVGCEDFFISEVEPPKSGTEPQLVVHSYLSPDEDEIVVSVKKSRPIFYDDYKEIEKGQVENAKITITRQNTEQKAVIPFNFASRKYVIKTNKFPLKQGETYRLNVATPDGKSVEAFCTIPESVKGEIRNIQLKPKRGRDRKNAQISFEFDDLPKQKKYYGVIVKYYGKYRDDSSVEWKDSFLFTADTNDDTTVYAKSTKEIFSSLDKIKRVEIRLLSMDKNCYDYLKTIQMQVDNGEGNPFKEPTIIVSNIKNGLGVFGAYTVKTAEKVFKP